MSENTNPRTREDAQLGLRLASGDDRAFDALVRLHGPAMQRLAGRLMGWRNAQADDVVQDVFLQVLRKRRGFRGDSSVKTWLMRLVVNHCRSRQRRRILTLETLWRALHRRPQDQSADAPPGDDTAQAVRNAVQQLPAGQRETVVLYYLEQLPAAEVAAVLDISEAAVNVRLHRARGLLEQWLADFRGSDRG